ncbi:SPFH domain-containing protein [Pseudobacter ginsenosidimutans]|uniref:Regulator of protease activity HflC (Stomatin/prohibitin superfamily) n=1 Tax=Pseudobacter ginsenosidimutans TaxID=661488 RepID=A0A4Q7MH40_9BACT|nr:SPFH domain-containing protein [Pseudobacter ginsenosidimutans]QEC45446.1 SPFH domain-containing protein [Pseudobacter ginsenosidimutans]RZS66977.1 regulator of protease activity HflC (stomatin/prohibitin superfamily) [Pseudobacter ginsenosidimutans]
MEKIFKPVSGYLALIIATLGLVGGIVMLINSSGHSGFVLPGIILIIASIFVFKGIMVVNPNHSRVCVFFGKYIGSVKENGLLWVNPLYSTLKISLRSENLESSKLKVNDKLGNPIEIAAVIVWQVQDTYKAAFEVEDYDHYVKVQSEAAIRHLATTYPYDQFEDENATITLRDGGEKVNDMLEKELNDRLAPAGIIIREARISHLAYAAEIAGAMLQRQQATAIVAARYKIVEGAVGMVELALEQLSKKEIVKLDEEKKAAMVSNLMVVLCGEKGAQPILNTGTLYQ